MYLLQIIYIILSKVDEVMETGEEIEETTTPAGVTILSLKLLPMTKLLQSKHGLRHGDYQRYRGYCSRYSVPFGNRQYY